MASDLGIQSAEVVLTCRELDETVAFFTTRLGFRLDTIMPADTRTSLCSPATGCGCDSCATRTERRPSCG